MIYIFDFDGTLVDSMEIWAGTHAQQLTDAGIPCPPDYVRTITPMGNLKAAELNISLGVKGPVDTYLERVNKKLFEAYSSQIPLKPHVKETLIAMRRAGHRLQVLTAAPHQFLDICLKHWDIFPYFEHVWSIDDFGLTKSDPAIYELAAAALHAHVGECIFVDDNLTAIRTANTAGMQTVAIYDPSSAGDLSALQASADRFVYDFAEI